MFFYISFLRPPPLKALTSAPLSVTPQIANDLRTELYSEPQDIYYAWRIHSGPQVKPNQVPAIANYQKLTNWRQGNAYKELLVPPPHGIKEGQTFSLVLTTHANGYPHIVNLGSEDVGQRPFPVISMPIRFISSNSKAIDAPAAEKQEHVERIYRIPLGPTEQVFMCVREQTSFDLDKKVWDSGVGLSSWIFSLATDNGIHASELLAQMRNALLSAHQRKIVELGAGTGIVSLTLGALRSAHSPEDGCIITTDLPSAMPLLDHNISSNTSLFSSDATRPKSLTLDWEHESLPPEVSTVDEGFDVIIMADVTYNTSTFPSLIRTVSDIVRIRSSTLSTGSKLQETMVLLAYKERDQAERMLWEMMRTIGVHLENVAERRGAGGEPVEVWIGTTVGLARSQSR